MGSTTVIETLQRILNLIQKELMIILKDPASRVILFAPVLMQSLLFGYAATFDLNNVPYAVLDQSRGQASTELLAHLDSTNVFHRIANLDNPNQIQSVIDAEQALIVIHINPEFETQLTSGGNAPIQVILDARNSSSAGMASGYLASIITNYNQQLRQQAGLADNPIRVVSRAWYNPNLETRWTIIPGLIASLAFLQTMLMTALSVAREREQGTFDMLMVTPMSPFEIMAGKAIAPMMIGLIQSTIVLLVSIFWFNIPFQGSVLTLYIGLFVFTLSSVGIGLSISALSVSMQQAMLYAFVLLMPMVLLSGLTTPVSNMPDILQIVTYANPLRFAMDFVRRVYLEGAPLAAVAHNLLPMAIEAAFTLPLAAWLFRHRLT